MTSRQHLNIQGIDKATLERLLQERLEDSTPKALGTRDAGSHEHKPRVLHPAISTTSFVDVDAADIPERRESRVNSASRPLANTTSNMAERRLSSRSSCSVAQSQLSNAPSEKSYVAATGGKRGYVLYELFDTEQIYVKDLEILVAVFAVSLRKHAGPWSMQAEQMLQPLQLLFEFQRQFLKSLCGRTSVATTAQLFLSEAHQFAAYIDYCGTYHWLCDLLERLKNDSGWPDFVDEFQQRMEQCSDKRRLGLRDFLIKPVQRICKYPLFLKELLKYTDECSEASTFDKLSQALAQLKGVCEGVDQVQQRIDSLRLRSTLLSSYYDNSELPLHVVAKLGEIVLSGPLRIVGRSEKGPEPPCILGCVLFKRFLLILRPKRSGVLVPQFWFPLHTMQAVDSGLAHSWQLQHVKSSQYMVFQATSTHEKQMWLAALNEAIVNSVVYVKRRQAKHAAAGKLPVQQTQDIDNSTNKSVSDESSGPNSAHVSPILNVATIAAVAAAAAAATSPPPPSSSSKPTNSRSFWSSKPFALTKSSMTEKHFKGFTSPEILRLHAVEALKHEKLPETFLSLASRVPSPPRIPFLATSQPPDTSPDNEAHTNNRPSNGSYPSHITAVDADQYTEADTDSDEYGAFSISSTCHEPIRQPALKYNHFVEDNAQRRSFDDIQDIISEIGGAPTAGSKDSFSERLFGALGHFHTAKRRTAATHIGMFGDGRTDAGACHERSFSVGAYGRKC